jgi:hypothetical protein
MSNATYPNPGLKWGLIAGLAFLIINVSALIGYPDFYFSSTLRIVNILVIIIPGILAGLERKRLQGGYITFKSAIQAVFTTYVIGSLIISIYSFVSYKMMSPALQARTLQSADAMTRSILHAFGVPDKELDSEMANYHMAPPTIGATIFGWFQYVIRYFVAAAIISVCIRKKAKK